MTTKKKLAARAKKLVAVSNKEFIKILGRTLDLFERHLDQSAAEFAYRKERDAKPPTFGLRGMSDWITPSGPSPEIKVDTF